MSNALKNIAGGFFNIDSGFGRTLIDLFYRPGHLIREFVTGRRAFYFRPFQMLFIMAAIYVMTVQLVDPDALRQEQLLQSEAITPEQKAKVKQVSDSVKQVVTYELEEEGINVRELTDLLTDEVGIPIVSEGKSNLLTGDNSLTNRFNRFVESHPFVKRVVDLLKGWFHGNKAFLVLITLPLFALATRFVFRKPRYRPRFNITEHLFVQAFIACQLLLVSIVVLLIHGHAQVDDLYEVSFPGIFLIFCFDYRQLYAISWWQSLWCTCKMFLFALLLIILLATLVVAVWFSFLLS